MPSRALWAALRIESEITTNAEGYRTLSYVPPLNPTMAELYRQWDQHFSTPEETIPLVDLAPRSPLLPVGAQEAERAAGDGRSALSATERFVTHAFLNSSLKRVPRHDLSSPPRAAPLLIPVHRCRCC